MAVINLSNTPLFQSGYTYLQAVGSNGSDNTAPGRHLRWDFLKSLGENHLPKGNYTGSAPYSTNIAFNKTNDFVKIYRSKFTTQYFVELNTLSIPTSKTLVNGKWVWAYTIAVNGISGQNRTVNLTFTNTSAYSNLAATLNPAGNETKFIEEYPGLFEVNIVNQLFYSCSFEAIKNNTSLPFYLRSEAIGLTDSFDLNSKQLNVRKKYTDPTQSMSFQSENTSVVRFDGTNFKELKIKLCTYEDHIVGTNNTARAGQGDGSWDLIGNFALTLEDNEMSSRFVDEYVEGTSGKWPKFNGSNQTTGLFTVKKSNYYNRWRRNGFSFNSLNESNNDTDGLQHFVHTYMKNSVTDTKAILDFDSDGENDLAKQTMSCLDMLRLVSMDYHVGRILGLGHLDIDRSVDTNSYVYCLEYITTAALESPLNTAATRTHLFMSLPTSYLDFRLPNTPVLDNLTFGSNIENGTNNPTNLCDINGYVPQADMRFININRKKHQYEKGIAPFFSDSTEFILANESQCVSYGLEYKEISETIYRIPEISNDPSYLDATGTPETIPIIENGGPLLFTHLEEEEGTHIYAAYGINWFSRVSTLSNTKEVTTDFPEICRMLPPFNFATQLIQDEDPAESSISEKVLILTTEAEQQQLATIPVSEDKTLVRTTFDWNHVHNHAHSTVDYAEFFFREEDPVVVKGKISSVEQLDNDFALISTTSYEVTSIFPSITIQPTISTLDIQKFIGSMFSTGQTHFFIEDIQNPGNNPKFLVRVLKETTASAPVSSNQNQFILLESSVLPEVGDLFFVIENLVEPSAWDLRHNTRVYLEKFYSNANISLRYSPTLSVSYGVNSLDFNSGNTTIILNEKLKSTNTTGVTVEYQVRKSLDSFYNGLIRFQGNFAADIIVGMQIRIFGHEKNDGLYTISTAGYYDAVTDLTSFSVTQPILETVNFYGVVSFIVNRPLVSINVNNNTLRIAGNKLSELNLANIEFTSESDGSQTRFVVGGINSNVTFIPLLDDLNNGTGFIQVITDTNILNHPDPRVEWYKGIARLSDVAGQKQVYPISYIGNLSGTSSSNFTFVIQDPGFIPADPSIVGSTDFYTLDLNQGQIANIHPSYRLYLKSNDGLNPITGAPITSGQVKFKESFILPSMSNATNKQTLMSVRGLDVYKNLFSYLSSPTVLLAQKINAPIVPALPKGPLFASRPDVYGKSTYTFDTVVDTTAGRLPYGMVFYRASNDKILDILYKKETQQNIFLTWNNFPESFRKDPGLWNVLFNCINNDVPTFTHNFMEYLTFEGAFTWPLPDNEDYFIPYQSSLPISVSNPAGGGGYYHPFKNSNDFKLDQNNISVYGKNRTAKSIIKKAIEDAFIPLTEQPVVFSHLKSGKQTSSSKSVLRDTNGNLLDPIINDIYPMVRTFTENGETKIRFTDYTIDGASTSTYFYCASEIDTKFKTSLQSPILGPVQVVDSFAPEKPQIRKTIIQLRNDSLELPAAVIFDLNPYIASERITKIAIYRCVDEIDALSVRSMTLVATVPFENSIQDTFEDVDFPLYGEQIYYRLVAIREVLEPTDMLNTQAVRLIEVPSKPSEVIQVTLADNYNPEAPILSFVIQGNTISAYENVQILWSSTCYNGTYSLQKMNNSGNWNEIYKINQKTGIISYPPLDINGNPDFTNFDKTVLLPKKNEDDQNIYHRYRVVVENSSGLFNLAQNEFICQEIPIVGEDFDILNLEDNSGNIIY